MKKQLGKSWKVLFWHWITSSGVYIVLKCFRFSFIRTPITFHWSWPSWPLALFCWQIPAPTYAWKTPKKAPTNCSPIRSPSTGPPQRKNANFLRICQSVAPHLRQPSGRRIFSSGPRQGQPLPACHTTIGPAGCKRQAQAKVLGVLLSAVNGPHTQTWQTFNDAAEKNHRGPHLRFHS